MDNCPRCGHTFARGYGLRIIPHRTNAKTPDDECHGCLDCHQRKLRRVKEGAKMHDYKRRQEDRLREAPVVRLLRDHAEGHTVAHSEYGALVNQVLDDARVEALNRVATGIENIPTRVVQDGVGYIEREAVTNLLVAEVERWRLV